MLMPPILVIQPIEGGERFYWLACPHHTSTVLFVPGPRGLTPSEIAWEVVAHHNGAARCSCCAHVIPEHKQVFTGPTPATLNPN